MHKDEIQRIRGKQAHKLALKGRKIIDWFDDKNNPIGLPYHRPMTPYEKFVEQSKTIPGAKHIDEATFNLGRALLSRPGGLNIILSHKKK